MTDYTVNAKITVSGGDDDRAKIQDAVDAGLRELNGIASRYGFTITEQQRDRRGSVMSIDKDPATEEDTASGGPAEPRDPNGPPSTTDEDGTPVENPSGG